MNYLVLDTESTGSQRESKGSALDPRNRLVYVGYTLGNVSSCLPIEYSVGTPYGPSLLQLKLAISGCDTIVLFNAKHDLHWLRRYGLWDIPKPIWDCQLAEFILDGQKNPFPSLHNTSIRYGGHGKLDTVNEEYWKKGIDTDGVPEPILREYLAGDVLETERVFLGQLKRLDFGEAEQPYSRLYKLIWLNCQDEIITADMEWNGLKFDIKGLLRNAQLLESRIQSIDEHLFNIVGDSRINWDSPKQVSATLYGGDIPFVASEEYLFHYANNKKPPILKTRQVQTPVKLPRLVEPLPRTESADGKTFSTDTKVLRKLKASAKAKGIIELILERRGTQTQIDRYFRGIPKKYAEMGWEDEIVHGQFNHCVASTGRLSSSNPNLQNIDERVLPCLTTRFRT